MKKNIQFNNLRIPFQSIFNNSSGYYIVTVEDIKVAGVTIPKNTKVKEYTVVWNHNGWFVCLHYNNVDIEIKANKLNIEEV